MKNTVTVKDFPEEDGLLLVKDKIRVLKGSSSDVLKEHLRFAQIERKEAEETFTLIQQKRAQLEVEASVAVKRHMLKIQQVTLIENMHATVEEQEKKQWCGNCGHIGGCYKPH